MDKKTTKQKEQIEILKATTVILATLLSISLILSWIGFVVTPKILCENWGGKLYEDDNCYIVSDMRKCIDSDGYVSITNYNMEVNKEISEPKKNEN